MLDIAAMVVLLSQASQLVFRMKLVLALSCNMRRCSVEEQSKRRGDEMSVTDWCTFPPDESAQESKRSAIFDRMRAKVMYGLVIEKSREGFKDGIEPRQLAPWLSGRWEGQCRRLPWRLGQRRSCAGWLCEELAYL